MRTSRRAGERGFTLLEVVTAMMIFFLVISFSMWSTSGVNDQAMGAQRARQLRMLAEMKLGEISVFERYWDETNGVDGNRFEDLPEPMRDKYDEWTWSMQIQDVTAFGIQKDEHAPYLFGEPEEAKLAKEQAAQGADPGAQTGTGAAKKGEPQLLRQITLTVNAPGDEGDGSGDGLEIVTYLPMVAQKTAGKPAADPPR